jgi:hypothetical protein
LPHFPFPLSLLIASGKQAMATSHITKKHVSVAGPKFMPRKTLIIMQLNVKDFD